MLAHALKAKLPVIRVTTDDTINTLEVLEHFSKRPVARLQPSEIKNGFKPNTVYVFFDDGDVKMPYAKLYAEMVKHESTLVIVNPPKPPREAMAIGEMPVPKPMLLDFFQHMLDDKEAQRVVDVLGGTTLKTAAELARLTMSRDGALSARGMLRTRNEMNLGQQGLEQVATSQAFYLPPGDLQAYAQTELAWFLNETDGRLRPKGLLLDGPPGTGKTEAAKYVASEWGLPLYRIDVAGARSKWLGETEGNVAAAISRLDQEAPCVALIDEVEKLFKTTGHSHETSTSVLSQLLWWLAERPARVLVMMTTNDRTAIPPELYRPGRIDKVLMLHGLTKDELPDYVAHAATTYGYAFNQAPVILAAKYWMSVNKKTHVPQAQINELIAKAIKSKA